MAPFFVPLPECYFAAQTGISLLWGAFPSLSPSPSAPHWTLLHQHPKPSCPAALPLRQCVGAESRDGVLSGQWAHWLKRSSKTRRVVHVTFRDAWMISAVLAAACKPRPAPAWECAGQLPQWVNRWVSTQPPPTLLSHQPRLGRKYGPCCAKYYLDFSQLRRYLLEHF